MAAHLKQHTIDRQISHRKERFQIYFWNAHSVKPKLAELCHFLKEHSVKIMILTETHLKPHTTLALAGYTIQRSDRLGPKAGGGTAIIIHNSIHHKILLIPTNIKIEVTGISVTSDSQTVHIFAAYSPPNTAFSVKDIELLLSNNAPTIIAGDLNAKHTSWNSKKINSRGRLLYQHSLQNNYFVAGPHEATHFQGRYEEDVLDIAILNNINVTIYLQTIQELSSDHYPVCLTLDDEIETTPPPKKYNYHKADWPKFRTALNTKISETLSGFNSTKDIDEALDRLTAAVQESVEIAVPKTTSRPTTLFDLPPGLAKAVKIKNAARRNYQRHRTQALKTYYNRLNKQLKKDIIQHRQQLWDTTLESLNFKDCSLWKMSRKLNNKKEQETPLQGPFHLVTDKQAKANLLADAIEESFQPNPPNANTTAIETRVSNFISENPIGMAREDNSELICTYNELVAIVKSLHNGKAPGMDGISTLVIKHLTIRVGMLILNIFNACLSLSYFPTAWKTAKVLAFYKPGKPPKLPTSYRPISLLSTLSKILERVILQRIQNHIDQHSCLPEVQYGFRQGRSTVQQLLNITDSITDSINKRRTTTMVSLDISKAFDRVWHEGLLFKLIKLNFPSYIITIVHSYLLDRSFFITIKEQVSTTRQIKAGVPQGSCLGPTLFNLFTSDIPTDFPFTTLSLYADDAALMSYSINKNQATKYLQAALDILAAWYAEWRIEINASKTQAILFARARHPPDIKLKLHGEEINWVNSIKYLGVYLDTKLSWKTHTMTTTKKASARLWALVPLLKSKAITTDKKLQLYKAIVLPILSYAAPIWAGCVYNQTESMQILQNKALRLATQSPRLTRLTDLHECTNVNFLRDHLQTLALSFYGKILHSHVQHIQSLPVRAILPDDIQRRPIQATITSRPLACKKL